MLVRLLVGSHLTPNGVRFPLSLPPNRLRVAPVLNSYSLKLLLEILPMQQLQDPYSPIINYQRQWGILSNLARLNRWLRISRRCTQLLLEMKQVYQHQTLQAIRAINIKQVNQYRLSLLIVDIKTCRLHMVMELNSTKGLTWGHHREWCQQQDIKIMYNMGSSRGIYIAKDHLINQELPIIKVQVADRIHNTWVSLVYTGLQIINKSQAWVVPTSEVAHLVIENTILIFKLINKALLWTNQLVSCLLY